MILERKYMDNNEGLTISEIAEKLNVSKQCIYNKLKILKTELNSHIYIRNGVKYLTKEGYKIIDTSLNYDNADTIKNDPNNEFNLSTHKNEIENIKTIYEKRIVDLKEQISYLQKESLEKNRLLENMQVLLKEQKLIESKTKKKSWWKFWNN
jgi:predicted DNA-binding protein YlxM (UPF0122 family)